MREKLMVYSIALVMGTSACTPQKSSPPKPQSGVPAPMALGTGWDYLQKILKGASANVPLAEALAPLLRELNPEVVSRLRERIASTEGVGLVSYPGVQWSQMQRQFIVGESPIGADNQLLSRTLNLNSETFAQGAAFNQQLEIKISGIVQSAALQNILKTFNQQIRSDSTEIAAHLVHQLLHSNPAVIHKIDRSIATKDRDERIRKVIAYLKQVDFLFVQYGVSPSDQNAIVLYASVAGVLIEVLDKHPSVQILAQTVREYVDLTMKARRLVSMALSLQEYGDSLHKDAVVMGNSVKNIFDKIRDLQGDVEINLSADGKKKARAILNDFLSGRSQADLSLGRDDELGLVGFFEKKRALDQNVQDLLTRADKAARTLDNILLVSQKIATTVGVNLPPEFHQAVGVAVKVGETVRTAQLVSKAFSTGGIVGALGALSGGPATMALAAFSGEMGLSGSEAVILGELASIKRSLVDIARSQQELLENQKKMLVMIKDLALLIEEYHREEMMALTDIREEITDMKAGLSEIDDSAFRACQAMTSYTLSRAPYYLKPEVSTTLPLVQRFLYSNVTLMKKTLGEMTKTPRDLRQFINSGAPENFETCQGEISNVFLNRDHRKFSRALWVDVDASGNSIRDGSAIVRRYYDPALEYLQKVTHKKEGRWQHLGLHLPVLDVQSLMTSKMKFLLQPGEENDLSDLSNLTATNKLEKYVSALLVLHPYLSIDADVWRGPFEGIVEVANKEETLGRSRGMLQNAFKRIQIAIAQEALLVGEPLLPSLSQEWNMIVGQTQGCKPGSLAYCFVRENPLMMGNLLTFVLIQRMGGPLQAKDTAVSSRRAAYQKLLNQPEALAQLLGVSVDRIKRDSHGVLVLSLSGDDRLQVPLPGVEVVAQGHIQYTQAMSRLLRLQPKVAEELVKLSPQLSHLNYSETLFL